MNLFQHLLSLTNKESDVSRKQKKLPPITTSKVPPKINNTPKLATVPASTAITSGKLNTNAVKPKIITPTVVTPIVKQHNAKLTFSPYAWAKLLFMRDKTNNEVGAYGIATPTNLLHITDLAVIKQTVSSISTEFDDDGIADFFDTQVLAGRKPAEFARIWIHTHPGTSAGPSGTDFATFNRVFGVPDWSVMFILANGGATTCELRFNVGPKASLQIPVSIDYTQPFMGSDFDSWEAEYKANVATKQYEYSGCYKYNGSVSNLHADIGGWEEWYDAEFSRFEPKEDDKKLDAKDSISTLTMATCDFCTNVANFDDMLYCDQCGCCYCPTCIQSLDTRGESYICADCNHEIIEYDYVQ